MSFFLRNKSFIAAFLATSLLLPAAGGGYKPGYLRGKEAEVPNRWPAEKINPARLSPDETAVFQKLGPPKYVRFFRELSDERGRIYEWVYLEPVRLVTFKQGRQIEYREVDESTWPFNEKQTQALKWTGIAAGVVGGLALIYYYLAGR